MLRALRTIAAFFAVGACLGGLAWWALGSEQLRFRTLRFVGNTNAPEAHLRHLAGLEPGLPLLSLELDTALEGVRKHPWVIDASARRVFPDTVVITVEERQPQALLMLDGLYLVDAEGEPFRRATAPHLDYPVITGIPRHVAEEAPELGRRLVLDALRLLSQAEGHAGLTAREISEVRFDPESGYALVLRNGGEVLVGFRNPEEALVQLDVLASRGVSVAPAPVRVDLGSATTAVVTPL